MAGSPIPIYTQLDFQLIPLLNLVAEPIAGSATPSAGNVGKFYRNTVSKRLEYVLDASTIASIPYSGSIVNADIAVGAAIALSKLAVDPLARANHTGTQLAATISDLAAVVKAYRLDEFAAPTSSVSMGGQKIVSLADAVSATDATTLQQVQNLIGAIVNGHDWKDGVIAASSTNVAIATPGANIDGSAGVTGGRYLLYGQTAPAENGIWIWNGAATPMTRATDADVSAEVTSGMTVPVTGGTHIGQAILTTQDPIVLGTTGLAFTILANAAAYTQGTGISISGNVVSLVIPVAVTSGGTGAITAGAARTSLAVPELGEIVSIGALSAGVELSVVHTRNTMLVDASVYRNSDKVKVGAIGLRVIDATHIGVTADVAVTGAALDLYVSPLAG